MAQTSELGALFSSPDAVAGLDSILSSTPSGVMIVTAPDRIIFRVSDYALNALNLSRSDLEGRTYDEAIDVIPAYDAAGRRLPPSERPLFKALQGEESSSFELWVESNGEHIPVIVSAAPIYNWSGELIGAINSAADLRPFKTVELGLREAVRKHEALYHELTHRVKNHLQILAAMAALEARNPTRSTTELADQMKGQLQALATVYRGMCRAEAGARIEARTFLDEICRPYTTDGVRVETEVAPADLTLDSDVAGPVGMLVNEAVCNAYKHAFPDHRGNVHVALTRREPRRLRLEVADDGVGWGATDPGDASQHHHGLELMKIFAQQMHGELELSVHRLGGALVSAEMPEQ